MRRGSSPSTLGDEVDPAGEHRGRRARTGRPPARAAATGRTRGRRASASGRSPPTGPRPSAGCCPGLRSPCTTTPGTSPGSVRSRAAAARTSTPCRSARRFEHVGPCARTRRPSTPPSTPPQPGASCSAARHQRTGRELFGRGSRSTASRDARARAGAPSRRRRGRAAAGSAVPVPGPQRDGLVARLVVRERDLEHHVAAVAVARRRRPARRPGLERGTQDESPPLHRTGDELRQPGQPRRHRRGAPDALTHVRRDVEGRHRRGYRRRRPRRRALAARSDRVRSFADRCTRRGAPPGEEPGGTR